jgi:5-methylcytosine-specific restriction protein B
MNILDKRIEEELRAARDSFLRSGELLTDERLQTGYAAFRERFGPDKLKSLDGQALLESMHAHGNRQSLVYWLEFKNDEEFPGPKFGSIAGGSAHKFGLFRRKDSGQWVTGGSISEKTISEAEAVTVARKHREQLFAGVALLENLPSDAEDEQYHKFQEQFEKAAPDISGLGWAHKYLSLLFPAKLDDFHNQNYQRFNLIKLLQLPPEREGLYVCAGRFVRLANTMGWPMNHLTSTLWRRNGDPSNYWRIGTRLGETNSIWEDMRDGGCIAIGWRKLGDLSILEDDDRRRTIKQKLETEYPDDAPNVRSRKAGEIRNFLECIHEEDVVLAADGESILGLGRVRGPYSYEDGESAPHRRAVEWLSTDRWRLPISEGIRTTVFPIKKAANLVELERRLVDGRPAVAAARSPSVVTRVRRLDGIPGRVQSILERKGQAILYGPPGTGKTYWARKTAFDLAALLAFRNVSNELNAEQKAEVEGSETKPGLVRSCTFHPAYGYEDFLEGFRPDSNAGQLVFRLRDGIFKRICTDAQKQPDRKFFLLVDEINRGDIPRIFGELLTLLESDKRGVRVSLPVSGDRFLVPLNLYVIGTMNTADRSIALLDTALRRRFGFVELMPDTAVFGSMSVEGSVPLGLWLDALNDRIREHLGRDARNLQVGHAYFLENDKPVTEFSRFVQILAEDIIPLLEEYCYGNYDALTKILGTGMFDETKQRIREELFLNSHREELIQALLAPSPEIVTSRDVLPPAPAAEETEEGENEDNET